MNTVVLSYHKQCDQLSCGVSVSRSPNGSAKVCLFTLRACVLLCAVCILTQYAMSMQLGGLTLCLACLVCFTLHVGVQALVPRDDEAFIGWQGELSKVGLTLRCVDNYLLWAIAVWPLPMGEAYVKGRGQGNKTHLQSLGWTSCASHLLLH
jgi:hypothetical protein